MEHDGPPGARTCPSPYCSVDHRRVPGVRAIVQRERLDTVFGCRHLVLISHPVGRYPLRTYVWWYCRDIVPAARE